MSPRLLVSIVTYNCAAYLQACLDSLQAQSYRDFLVCIWDNASTDETLEIIAASGKFIHSADCSTTNVGFCAGQNRLISSVDSDYVLALNPDVFLEPGFIEALMHALDQDLRAGAASGKLWRWDGQQRPAKPRTLDTTGMYFTPSQRHFDRGSGELDNGQYETREYVFGTSGAAAFYRRRMLEEIQAGQEYFDESFFTYRDDADLAWRAQWMGWRCLYVPEATGFHVRRVLPERRASLPPVFNMHSFKNRFLLRMKNMDAGTYLRFLLPISARDLAAFAYVLARERTSLRGIPLLLRALPAAWVVRKALQRHRRVSAREMRSWFSYRPVSRPI
jgi:GT2 family glycosyltransferase